MYIHAYIRKYNRKQHRHAQIFARNFFHFQNSSSEIELPHLKIKIKYMVKIMYL